MTAAVDLVHRALTPAFDLACWPFLTLDPMWAMAALSLATGVAMVWIFGKVSDQTTIRGLREHIRGNLIGVRLFQRDIGVMLRLQRRIFADTFRYLRYALIPMVVLLVPVVLIMTQLNLRFSVRPLEAGEDAVVKAYVRDASTLDQAIALEAGPGVRVETDGVRIPSTREVAWRVRADTAGEHRLVVRVGDRTVETVLVAGSRWGAVPQRRTGRGVWETLLYPGAPPIPATHPVEAVEIDYPSLDLGIMGWSVDWLVAFFVLSLAFGFTLKGRLGVEV